MSEGGLEHQCLVVRQRSAWSEPELTGGILYKMIAATDSFAGALKWT